MNYTGQMARAMGVAAAFLCLSASTGIAGGSSNPDVIDIDTRLSQEQSERSKLNYNNISIRTGQEVDYFSTSSAYNSPTRGTYVKGYFGKSDEETGMGMNVMWFAAEPDSVKRTASGATISQSSYVGVYVSLYGESTSAREGQFVEGCSAKAKVKFKEGDESTSVKSAASLKCPKSAWEDIGFNEQQIELLEELMKSPKVKFGFKGEEGRGIRPPPRFEDFELSAR